MVLASRMPTRARLALDVAGVVAAVKQLLEQTSTRFYESNRRALHAGATLPRVLERVVGCRVRGESNGERGDVSPLRARKTKTWSSTRSLEGTAWGVHRRSSDVPCDRERRFWTTKSPSLTLADDPKAGLLFTRGQGGLQDQAHATALASSTTVGRRSRCRREPWFSRICENP